MVGKSCWQSALPAEPPSQRRPLSGIYVGLICVNLGGRKDDEMEEKEKFFFFFVLMARTASPTWPRRLSLACVTVSVSNYTPPAL